MKRWICIFLILLLCLTAMPTAAAEAAPDLFLELNATRTANRLSAAVTVQNPHRAVVIGILICSIYDDNGRMLETVSVEVDLSAESAAYPVAFRSDAEAAATIKAFLLQTGSWTPCCEAVQQDAPEIQAPSGDETEDIPIL